MEHNYRDSEQQSYFSVLHISLNIHREIRDLISLDDEISGNLIFFKRVPKKNSIAIRL